MTASKSRGRTGLAVCLIILGTLASTTVARAATISPSSPPAITNHTRSPSTNYSKLISTNAPQARFSRGIADIVSMVEAKVDPEVILAYIRSSPIAYNPGAREIIALRALGVPDGIITALLEHGAELRAASSQAAQAPAAPPGPPPAAPSAPPPSQYPAYGAGYPGYPLVNYSYNTLATVWYGPLISFNNSAGTLVNGHIIYSGYYVPGYGILW